MLPIPDLHTKTADEAADAALQRAYGGSPAAVPAAPAPQPQSAPPQTSRWSPPGQAMRFATLPGLLMHPQKAGPGFVTRMLRQAQPVPAPVPIQTYQHSYEAIPQPVPSASLTKTSHVPALLLRRAVMQHYPEFCKQAVLPSRPLARLSMPAIRPPLLRVSGGLSGLRGAPLQDLARMWRQPVQGPALRSTPLTPRLAAEVNLLAKGPPTIGLGAVVPPWLAGIERRSFPPMAPLKVPATGRRAFLPSEAVLGELRPQRPQIGAQTMRAFPEALPGTDLGPPLAPSLSLSSVFAPRGEPPAAAAPYGRQLMMIPGGDPRAVPIAFTAGGPWGSVRTLSPGIERLPGLAPLPSQLQLQVPPPKWLRVPLPRYPVP